LNAADGCENETVLTLMCAKMILAGIWVLKMVMVCGIVTTVIKSDELNADRTKIFLPRDSLRFFQRCSGTITREVSETTSAAGSQNLSTAEITEA